MDWLTQRCSNRGNAHVVCGDACIVKVAVVGTEARKNVSNFRPRKMDRFTLRLGTRGSRCTLPPVSEGSPRTPGKECYHHCPTFKMPARQPKQDCQEKVNTAKNKLPFLHISERKWPIIFLRWPFADQLKALF